MDPSLSFYMHYNYVPDRIDKINTCVTFTVDLQRIREIYRKLCCTNASDLSFKNIQTAQNAALRTATGAQNISSIDHQEYITLKVRYHSDMLSEHCLVNCLEEDHVWHVITTQDPRSRPMKKTLHSRHHSTVLPRVGASKKENIQNMNTHAVKSVIQLQGITVQKDRPPQ